ncbi:MAG TPA: septation protein SepH, partial [Ornithinibacter sp.]|nr:septation protein SepH [Ornithinibacter sp.]
VGSRGAGPVTLAERVSERLHDRGVDRDDVEWDSCRDDEGVWQLNLTFAAGGRQRTATWRYEPLSGSVTATNDEARWLSEEAEPGAIPTPHSAGLNGDSDVYDIDADGGVDRASRERQPHEPIDLMAAMREHSTRGRRRRRPSPSGTPGDDRPRADALPIEDLVTDLSQAPPPPAARGRNPVSAHLEEPTDSGDVVGGWPDHESDHPSVRTGDAPRPEHPAPDGGRGDSSGPSRPSASRKGRPSVPSWDDIVFGTRGGGSA